MEDSIFDDLAIEKAAKDRFGISIDIAQMIARKIPLSRTTYGYVFLTDKKQLFAYIDGTSKLLLGDIKKLIARMGLKAELYIPPKGHPTYFDDIGKAKFVEVFPGRRNPSTEDLVFYRTLAPYSPALVQIQEVKNGEIYQYDSDTKGDWRTNVRFTYRRIKTL